MHLAKLAARGAVIVFACISAVIAAPFQNGSFEVGTDPGGGFLTLPSGDTTDITGWTVISGNIDYIGGYWQPAQGSRSLDLIGDQFVGGVQQTFDTIPGATYSVSFDMAGNPAGGPTIRPLAVTVAGNTNNFTFDITGATLANMNWTTHQFTFVATGITETIQFVSDLTGDPAGCCYGAALDNVQIAGLPDLTIVKSHTGNFTQGQAAATYTITVTNAGAGPTSGAVSVVDSLPSGLIATAISGSGWSCVLGTLTCTRSDALDVGLGYPDITLTVTVANNAPALATNIATVSGGGDINPGNNSASDPTIILQVADLTITKSHSGSFTLGQTGATYTITVTNSGAGATSGTVTVVDTLPAGLSATAVAGTGWNCILATLTCTRSDPLTAGLSYPSITLTVTVANNAPASVTNTVTVAGGGEINTGNNSASDPTTVVQVADLTITKGHSGSFTQGQAGATYTITVTNNGVGPTSGTVTVVDTLPAGLSATAISGTGWICALATLTCTRSDVLAAGLSYPALTLTVTVANNAPASVTNTVTVAGGGEINTGNNSASDPTTVVQVADLTITKSHSGSFTQGQAGATYTITVTNNGVGPTSGTVTAVDILPAGLSATAISGTGWICALATLTCTRSDVLAAGLSYPALTLTVTVANNAPASVTNTVTVAGGGEVTTGNNSANDPTTIIQIAGLALSKTHTGNFTQGQIGATYTLTLTNTGAGPTTGAITVTDMLPSGLSATGFSGSGWSCSLAPLSCTRSDPLGAGASYPPIILIVNVSTNAPSAVTNTALATGGAAPPAPSNTANDTTQIVPVRVAHTAIPTLQDAMLVLLSLCMLALAAWRLRGRGA